MRDLRIVRVDVRERLRRRRSSASVRPSARELHLARVLLGRLLVGLRPLDPLRLDDRHRPAVLDAPLHARARSGPSPCRRSASVIMSPGATSARATPPSSTHAKAIAPHTQLGGSLCHGSPLLVLSIPLTGRQVRTPEVARPSMPDRPQPPTGAPAGARPAGSAWKSRSS